MGALPISVQLDSRKLHIHRTASIIPEADSDIKRFTLVLDQIARPARISRLQRAGFLLSTLESSRHGWPGYVASALPRIQKEPSKKCARVQSSPYRASKTTKRQIYLRYAVFFQATGGVVDPQQDGYVLVRNGDFSKLTVSSWCQIRPWRLFGL